MKKTHKKIENNIRQQLTLVCDIALKQIAGFAWLTHEVNYSNFQSSFNIICIFESSKELEAFSGSTEQRELETLIESHLQCIDIRIKRKSAYIHYDSEEACQHEHAGKWATRLAKYRFLH